MLKIGDFELHSVSDGFFRLDGGAMFGVVPKVLWDQSNPSDDRNRIELALGCLLMKTPRGHHVLVDTGLSSKYESDPKFLRMFDVRRERTLFHALKERGLEPEDIDLVINTHLHFDHCGGNTLRENGRVKPAFPKAKYIVQKAEWEDATHPHERNKASYLPENFLAVDEAKQLELVDGEFEIEPGLKVLKSGGHTRGHQCALVESQGQGALFLGDLIPTRSHVPLPWIMGYDLFPLDTLHAKRRLLAQAKERDWLLVFQHDPKQRAGYLKEADGREVIVPPEALEA
ncbi:MAG: MBL fold metallo-hydrolase [Elusimicrobia bacterium]|nr:MBL fold metallo-hydrolase [Elusimicrobiota bacterium]